MKTNDFICKLQNVIKGWLLFFLIWIIITTIQVVFISKFSGYSVLFENFNNSTTVEKIIACFCLVFYGSWWIIEIVKYISLGKEYKEFIKSLNKTEEIKRVIYRLKILFYLIIIITFFSIIGGGKNNFNCTIVLLGCVMKLLFIFKFKHLIDLISVSKLEEYGILERQKS